MISRSKAVFLSLVLLAFVASGAWAHPPLSIVVDDRGRVFYSDLQRVWVQEGDGSRRVAVPDVHNHEMRLGDDGSVLGEDVMNVGERYRHRVWRLAPDGALTDALPWREGHPADHGDLPLVVDSRGRSYVLRHTERRLDILAGDDTRRSIPIDSELGPVHAVAVSAEGTAFVTVGRTLLRLQEGARAFEVVAENLGRRSKAFDFVHERHAFLGLWLASDDSVFIADFAGQQVIRVTETGLAKSTYQSEGQWSPCAGVVDARGKLWILEWSTGNEARLRRVDLSASARQEGAKRTR